MNSVKSWASLLSSSEGEQSDEQLELALQGLERKRPRAIGTQQTTLFDFQVDRSTSKHVDPKRRRMDDGELAEAIRRLNEFRKARGLCCISPEVSIVREWTYPTDPPVREYQKKIAEACLYDNVLVSLPTGLGKTLIAAVVMFNFFRFFPDGKLVFLAPTKPLVEQQIEACLGIMHIPEISTTFLTGKIPPERRSREWISRRVFFATPQTVLNDIQNELCPVKEIVLVVIDEAHHSLKNYAYVPVIKSIAESNANFRVLGLSATPGTDLNKVQEVINNLMISRLIVKDSEDADVRPYVHETKSEVILVQSSSCMDKIESILKGLIDKPLHRLTRSGILHCANIDTLSAFYVHKTMREQMAVQGNKAHIGDLGLLFSLLSGLNRLKNYGLKSCYDYMNSNIVKNTKLSQVKKGLRTSPDFVLLMKMIEDYRDVDAEISHPKLVKSQELLEFHFQEKPDSRAIVFTEYRSSVEEIVEMLNKNSSTVRAQKFVGQSSSSSLGPDEQKLTGMTQKQQKEVIESFKQGFCNTLVATSIAEEGLDIGEVDLIICFDMKTSAIRSTQRSGRTGRRRVGRCISVVTQKEYETYERNCMKNKNLIELLRKRCENGPRSLTFFSGNVSMLPIDHFPELCLSDVPRPVRQVSPPRKKADLKPSIQLKPASDFALSSDQLDDLRKNPLCLNVDADLYQRTFSSSSIHSFDSKLFLKVLETSESSSLDFSIFDRICSKSNGSFIIEEDDGKTAEQPIKGPQQKTLLQSLAIHASKKPKLHIPSLDSVRLNALKGTPSYPLVLAEYLGKQRLLAQANDADETKDC